MDRSSFKLLSAASVLACATSVAHAGSFDQLLADFRDATAHGKQAYVVDIDNDSLLLRRDDRFYTGGVRLASEYTKGDAGQSTTYGWRIGQDMYTASDTQLEPAEIGPHDHPYGAWLYGGVYKKTDEANGEHLKLGLDFGCLGACAGGSWAQTTTHHLLRQKQPKGWSTQLRNEVGAIVYGDIAWQRWSPAPWLDVTPSMLGRFGNIHSDASAVATLRFGRLNALPDQSTLHGFLRGELRAVAYDATLQGGYFSSGNPHTVKPKRAVGEIELGVAWISAPYRVRSSIVRRGNEIEDLSNAIGSQSFARFQLTYAP